MKLALLVSLLGSCTSQKKLAYLNNLQESAGKELFPMNIPDYRIQYRDILYITIKAMGPDGNINDYLSGARNSGSTNFGQGEAGQYLMGYNVSSNGDISLPVLGSLNVEGLTLEESRAVIQRVADKHFLNSLVECKLLSFKFTVIGEVKTPGTYVNFNNYLTILEAIGRAGGMSDYGSRSRILVLRTEKTETKTFTLNLQDKALLTNQAYFILPNDVIIVDPEYKKIFSLNLPTFSFILTSVTSVITTTLLMINYLK